MESVHRVQQGHLSMPWPAIASGVAPSALNLSSKAMKLVDSPSAPWPPALSYKRLVDPDPVGRVDVDRGGDPLAVGTSRTSGAPPG